MTWWCNLFTATQISNDVITSSDLAFGAGILTIKTTILFTENFELLITQANNLLVSSCSCEPAQKIFAFQFSCKRIAPAAATPFQFSREGTACNLVTKLSPRVDRSSDAPRKEAQVVRDIPRVKARGLPLSNPPWEDLGNVTTSAMYNTSWVEVAWFIGEFKHS